MVVYNLDFKGAGIDLPEADAPRDVNPNAVLPLAITCQDLQAIAWNRSKIAQGTAASMWASFRFITGAIP
jgi:hypothetical protein